jgi:hypothetical protein
LAAVREEYISFPIQQKIAAGLVNIILAVVFPFHTLAQQLPVQAQCRRREYVKPRKPFQGELSIPNPLGIGKDRERPLMMFLIGNQFGRLGERNNGYGDAAPVKFIFERFHLAEVGLARQSGEVPEKDEEQILIEISG